MTGKARLTELAVTVCALLAAGGIFASNMGYKLNYPLDKPGTAGSKSGTCSLSLPYLRQIGVDDALGLMQNIEEGGPPFSKIVSVAKFLEATDGLQVYTGRMGSPGANFALVAGEGYRVQMSGDVNYVLVGSHDPSVVLSLDAPGSGSKSGTNDVAFPYGITSATADDLIREIDGAPRGTTPTHKLISVTRFLRTTDALQVRTSGMGSPGNNFNLIPGESLRVQMAVTTPYIPSHY